jgi:hypothetical protein
MPACQSCSGVFGAGAAASSNVAVTAIKRDFRMLAFSSHRRFAVQQNFH